MLIPAVAIITALLSICGPRHVTPFDVVGGSPVGHAQSADVVGGSPVG
jgi:hypothetical protein